MQDRQILEIIDAILALEGSMAKYSAIARTDEFVERWQSARNEYLSLLTWLDKQL